MIVNMIKALLVTLFLAALTGCTPTQSFDISVHNQTNNPVTLWLTKDGPPFEPLWASPEDLAIQSPGADEKHGYVVLPPGKEGDVSVQGKIVAAVSPTLYARSAGTVSLEIHAGDKVEHGDVLATIESPELANKLKQEQSTLDSLTLDVERAGIDHRKQQLTSKKTLDQARIDRQTAEREVQRTSKAFTAGALPELDLLRAKDALAKGRRVATRVSELAAERRREEIARMLAGAEITAEARAAAERLIRAAG